ncbi:carbohydrate kinase [Nocardiopsis mangrovi]|uniref:Carbohydrate kinase n=1 Tax=Nocardiopsis mangrovi TaxID=1179818 RepID=A0ABV9DVV5_9ACTN
MSTPNPTAPRLAVLGENVVDFLPLGDDAFRAVAGGGPANIAVAAVRLGLPTALMARTGGGPMGELVLRRLRTEGVDERHLVRTAESTALAIAAVGADGGASYDFRLGDAADWNWTEGDLPERLDPAITALHTGSIAALRAPGADTVEALLRRERERGGVTIGFDPNMRPAVIDPLERSRARTERLAGLSHLVKVSDEDLGHLYPGTDTEEAARSLLDLGPGLVVVTKGGDGAVALTRAERVAVAAPEVEVADTVGAGDTFMGALLWRLDAADLLGGADLGALDADVLAELLSYAAAAAACVVTRPGADPPTAEEVESMRLRV